VYLSESLYSTISVTSGMKASVLLHLAISYTFVAYLIFCNLYPVGTGGEAAGT
jgi:hypothetical protein